MEIGIIIIAKDEEETLPKILQNIKDLGFKNITIVDGSSSDATLKLAKNFEVNIIKDPGKGKGRAYKLAIEKAKEDILVFLDGDGSHNVGDIYKLVVPIIQGRAELVIASRMLGGSDELYGNINNYIRMLGGGLIALIINYYFNYIKKKKNLRLTDPLNGYKAIKRTVAQQLQLRADGFDIEHEIVIKCLKRNYRVVEVASHEFERAGGKSKLPTFRYAYKFIFRLFYELLRR